MTLGGEFVTGTIRQPIIDKPPRLHMIWDYVDKYLNKEKPKFLRCYYCNARVKREDMAELFLCIKCYREGKHKDEHAKLSGNCYKEERIEGFR